MVYVRITKERMQGIQAAHDTAFAQATTPRSSRVNKGRTSPKVTLRPRSSQPKGSARKPAVASKPHAPHGDARKPSQPAANSAPPKNPPEVGSDQTHRAEEYARVLADEASSVIDRIEAAQFLGYTCLPRQNGSRLDRVVCRNDGGGRVVIKLPKGRQLYREVVGHVRYLLDIRPPD